MIETKSDKALSAAIAEQKRLVAEDLFAEAWDGGIAAGIEPEILAELLARRAIEQFAAGSGEDAAASLFERLDLLHREGRLVTPQSLQ
jgi:hypothetical protein